jgi:hypothetical protein
MEQCINTWLLARDGAILTAAPAVCLQKLEERKKERKKEKKKLGFSTIIKIKVFSKLCHFPRLSFHSSI